MRMGVGRKPRRTTTLADWVLGKPAAEDRKAIDPRYPDAEAACRLPLMAGRRPEAADQNNPAGGSDAAAAKPSLERSQKKQRPRRSSPTKGA